MHQNLGFSNPPSQNFLLFILVIIDINVGVWGLGGFGTFKSLECSRSLVVGWGFCALPRLEALGQYKYGYLCKCTRAIYASECSGTKAIRMWLLYNFSLLYNISKFLLVSFYATILWGNPCPGHKDYFNITAGIPIF